MNESSRTPRYKYHIPVLVAWELAGGEAIHEWELGIMIERSRVVAFVEPCRSRDPKRMHRYMFVSTL